MPNKTQASPKATGEGRRLRWARNVIKKWSSETQDKNLRRFTQEDFEIAKEIAWKRYERACALIVAQKLKQ